MRKKSGGFTLIELIIVMTISGILMTILVTMFISGLRVFSDSNVKTTLQMDAKDIQERLSDICMQAESVKYVDIDESTGDIKKLIIDSYYKDNDKDELKPITIIKDEEELEINNFKVPSKIKNFKAEKVKKSEDAEDEEDAKNSGSSDLVDADCIKFHIVLKGSEGFSKDVEYPMSFTIKFRNASIN